MGLAAVAVAVAEDVLNSGAKTFEYSLGEAQYYVLFRRVLEEAERFWEENPDEILGNGFIRGHLKRWETERERIEHHQDGGEV